MIAINRWLIKICPMARHDTMILEVTQMQPRLEHGDAIDIYHTGHNRRVSLLCTRWKIADGAWVIKCPH